MIVTGHSGFKGSWLRLWLEQLGAQVAGYSLPPPEERSTYSDLGFAASTEPAWGDLRDLDRLAGLFTAFDPEIVFHLGAQALVPDGYRDPVETFAVNLLGTVHLLEAARRAPSLRAVVVVTSDKCYENREWAWSYREKSQLGGRDPYSASKACAELAVRAYRDSFLAPLGVRVATARAGNVIGGGDWAAHRLVPDIVRALLSGRPVELRHPSAIRPWQFVLEPLSGYLLLGERLYGADGEAFASSWNFAPREEDAWPVSKVVERFGHHWGVAPEIASTTEDLGHEATYLKLDASLARMQLSWKPRLDLDEALAWTAEGYRAIQEGRGLREVALAQIGRYEARG